MCGNLKRFFNLPQYKISEKYSRLFNHSWEKLKQEFQTAIQISKKIGHSYYISLY